MKPPVVLLAFANDSNDYLPQLDLELEHLRSMLIDWDQKGFIDLQVLKRASLQDIYSAVSANKDRLAILHYAGHASGTQLALEEESVNAVGIARLLQEQAKAQLQLVFLNGCSTLGQVQQLHQYGVKAVIATHVSIPDNQAVLFAARFYESLASLHSIKQAFEQAAAYVNASQRLMKSIGGGVDVFRDLVPASKVGKGLPWGLYLNQATPEDWDWKLPQFKSHTPQNRTVTYTGHYQPNLNIPDILEEMVKYKPAIQRDMYNDEDEPIDRSDYNDLIIKHFPSPIGIQIQKLVSQGEENDVNKVSLERLKQILSTYIASTQLMTFILLSEFWDLKREKNISILDYELNKPLSIFPNLSKPLIYHYHYFEVIDQMAGNYVKNELPTFVEELVENKHDQPLFEQIKNKEGEFYQACQRMEDLKLQVKAEQIKAEELEKTCKEAEDDLVLILKKLSFLAKYKLLTVRDIELFRPRFYDNQFQHRYANLNLSMDSNIAVKEKRILSSKPADSGSVIMVKKTNDIDHFLSLSPFVIDRYAFDQRADSHIYLYAFREQEKYVYFRSTSDFYKAIEDPDDQLNTGDMQQSENANFAELLEQQFSLFYSDLIKYKV